MRNPSTLPLSSPKAELPHPGESFVTTTDPFRESGKFTPMGVAAFDVLGRKELQLRLSKAARRLHSEQRCLGQQKISVQSVQAHRRVWRDRRLLALTAAMRA
jgi:hypothetical protein